MKFIQLIFWFFTPKQVQRLKEQQNSPFKLKLETESLKATCIAQISADIKPLWLSVKRLLYKLGIKKIQNNAGRINRDEFGKETVSPNPVFTPNEAARICIKQILYMILVILFLAAEANLYYLVAALFVPGGGTVLKIICAVFMAVLIMYAIYYGVQKHINYYEAVDRHSKREISDTQLRIHRDLRNAGYVLIALSMAAVIFAGYSRIFFLEYIPANGLDEAKQKSVQKASQMASIFTMVLTLITAWYMGVLKHEQYKNSVRFRVLRGWRKALVRRNKYTQELIAHAHSIILIAEQRALQHWLLVLEVKRLYKMEDEFDQKYQGLNEDYLKLKSHPGFSVTDDLYATFSPIQCAHEELFMFGVLNNKAVKEKIAFAKNILSIPEAHLVEHIRAVDKESDQTPKPVNGKAKEPEFANI